MNFNFILPLHQQALVVIADTLWNSQCVERLLRPSASHYSKSPCGMAYKRGRSRNSGINLDDMMHVELRIKISRLLIPETTKHILKCIARSVGEQKLCYCIGLKENWNIEKVPKNFRWTPQGIIDKKKTAESLIKDERIDIGARYSMACFYCFEEEIRKLSGKVPMERICEYGNKLTKFWYRTIMAENQHSGGNKLTKFWYRTFMAANQHSGEGVCWVDDDKKKIKNDHEAFIYSLDIENSFAAEYFWGKLPKGKKCSLPYLMYNKYFSELLVFSSFGEFQINYQKLDVALFLLKQMTKDEQIENISAYWEFFDICLEWPFHGLFFKLCEVICSNVTAITLSRHSQRILRKISFREKDFDFLPIFKTFWHTIISFNKKEDVLNDLISESHKLLYDLFLGGYVEIIILIFREATATQKETFIGSVGVELFCKECVFREEWELVIIFINTCVPSTAFNMAVKESIKRFRPKGKVDHVFKILRFAEYAGNSE